MQKPPGVAHRLGQLRVIREVMRSNSCLTTKERTNKHDSDAQMLQQKVRQDLVWILKIIVLSSIFFPTTSKEVTLYELSNSYIVLSSECWCLLKWYKYQTCYYIASTIYISIILLLSRSKIISYLNAYTSAIIMKMSKFKFQYLCPFQLDFDSLLYGGLIFVVWPLQLDFLLITLERSDLLNCWSW